MGYLSDEQEARTLAEIASGPLECLLPLETFRPSNRKKLSLDSNFEIPRDVGDLLSIATGRDPANPMTGFRGIGQSVPVGNGRMLLNSPGDGRMFVGNVSGDVVTGKTFSYSELTRTAGYGQNRHSGFVKEYGWIMVAGYGAMAVLFCGLLYLISRPHP